MENPHVEIATQSPGADLEIPFLGRSLQKADPRSRSHIDRSRAQETPREEFEKEIFQIAERGIDLG